VPYGENANPWDGNYGADLALLTIKSTKPVYEVHVVRPSLVSPPPQGEDDANGGVYDGLVGIAGWSPNPDLSGAGHRTFAWINSLYHYPGMGGQYWLHDNSRQSVYYGDSGGALFFQNPTTGTRDVVGITSAFDSSNSYWTDITRGAPRDWVRQHLVETWRSPGWLKAHGVTEHWRGEVDYWGPIRSDVDHDGDHWIDSHDNCPNTANTDQAETSPGGRGVACQYDSAYPPYQWPAPPPPPCNEVCTRLPNNFVWCRCTDIGPLPVVGITPPEP
jgi:hypothetical protein